MTYVSFAERAAQLMKRPTFVSAMALVVLVAGIILANGQLGAVISETKGQLGAVVSEAMRHGDIPPGDNCVTLTVNEGASVKTGEAVGDYAQTVANNPTNVDKLVRAAVEKYGDTLTRNETPVICGSFDGTQVATMDAVNLGR